MRKFCFYFGILFGLLVIEIPVNGFFQAFKNGVMAENKRDFYTSVAGDQFHDMKMPVYEDKLTDKQRFVRTFKPSLLDRLKLMWYEKEILDAKKKSLKEGTVPIFKLDDFGMSHLWFKDLHKDNKFQHLRVHPVERVINKIYIKNFIKKNNAMRESKGLPSFHLSVPNKYVYKLGKRHRVFAENIVSDGLSMDDYLKQNTYRSDEAVKQRMKNYYLLERVKQYFPTFFNDFLDESIGWKSSNIVFKDDIAYIIDTDLLAGKYSKINKNQLERAELLKLLNEKYGIQGIDLEKVREHFALKKKLIDEKRENKKKSNLQAGKV